MDSRLEPAPSPPRYVGLPPGLGVTQLRNFATCHSWVVSRSRARSAARPCTTSCGFETSEPIPFPGAESIFSSRCGAISGRLRPFAVRHSRAAIRRPKRLGSRDDDRLGDLRRDGRAGTNIEQLRNSGKKFVEWLGTQLRQIRFPFHEPLIYNYTYDIKVLRWSTRPETAF